VRIYSLQGYSIYSHLATEAYFLHHSSEDIILIWQSHNAVVCGKHQNIAAEVNYQYCKENNISIARRLTGGGTVFHDKGNICFTFIQSHSGKLENTIDYKRFLDPVKAFFNQLNIPVLYSPRNDLMIHNKKISGNAQHVFLKEKRVLHHGTLLFNSDLDRLGLAIKPKDGVLHKGVNSVRSTVANICDYTDIWKAPAGLMDDLNDYFIQLGYAIGTTSNTEQMQIQRLTQEKFTTDEWIWDYSPKHEVNRKFIFENLEIDLYLAIKNGRLEKVEFTNQGEPVFEELANSLLGSWRFDRIESLILKSKMHAIHNELTYLFF